MAALICAFACAISWAPRVQAHARLVSSIPAPGSALAVAPVTVRLTFTEPVDPRFSRADLLTSDGSTVPIAPLETDPVDGKTVVVRLLDQPAPTSGTYVLVWRVLSGADGHATSGALPFSVGTGQIPSGIGSIETSGRPPWWRIAARWLELASLMIVVGGFTFGGIVARPIWETPIAGGSLAQRWYGIWCSSAIALAFGLFLSLIDQGLIATGSSLWDPPSLSVYRRLMFDSTFGTAWLVRVAMLAGLVGVAFLISARQMTSSWLWYAGIGVGASMLLTVPFAGHAAGEGARTLAIATDWLHLLAGAIWLGGLVYLMVFLVTLRRYVDAEAGHAGAGLVGRFSSCALVTVGTLALTGVGNAALHVSGPRALRLQDYGATLIAKHVVVAMVLVAAAVNLLVNRPRLTGLSRLGEINAIRKQLRETILVVAAELTFGAAILAAAAALTELPPADAPLAVDVAAKEVVIDQRAIADDLELWLLGRLNGDPDDRFTVSVSSPDGQPATAIQRLIVEAAIAPTADGEAEVGDRFDAEPLAGSHTDFQFPAVRLGLRGMWNVSLIVRRAGREDVRALFSVDTREAGLAPPRAVADVWRLPRFTIVAWALFALAAIVAIGGGIGVRRLPGLEPLAAALILTMIALIAGGFAVSAVRQTIPVTNGTHLVNSKPGDAGSVQRGGTIYAANCLACHGPAGGGGTSADPEHGHGAAADLTDRRSRGQRDGDLYYAVTNGVPGSVMPAYDRALSEGERWDVVNYLRQLQREAAD